MGKRIEFVDLAKGLCIMLMVLRHSEIECQMLHYLRMPFYFFVSGIFFRSYGGLLALIKKKTNKLVIPFVFFYLLAYAVMFPCDMVLKTHLTDQSHILSDLSGMFYLNNPIWFLLCLFWCNILYYISTLYSNRWCICCINIAYLLLGLHLWNSGVFIPLHFSTSLVAMPFFAVGNFLSSTNLLYATKYDKYQIPMAVAIIAVLCAVDCLMDTTSSVEWFRNTYNGSFAIYFIFSFLMVIAALLLCKGIKKLPFVSYCGRYSIIILGVHRIIIMFSQPLFSSLSGTPTLQSLAIFVCALAISALAIPVMVRYVPWLVAQKDIVK